MHLTSPLILSGTIYKRNLRFGFSPRFLILSNSPKFLALYSEDPIYEMLGTKDTSPSTTTTGDIAPRSRLNSYGEIEADAGFAGEGEAELFDGEKDNEFLLKEHPFDQKVGSRVAQEIMETHRKTLLNQQVKLDPFQYWEPSCITVWKKQLEPAKKASIVEWKHMDDMERRTRERKKLIEEWLIKSNIYDEVRDWEETFVISDIRIKGK